MSERRPESAPGAISRFRAIVVASLRVKQLRRGAKPRIELDGKKHKDTIIAMEEVRRGLISFTQSGLPHIVQHDYPMLSSIPSVDAPNGMGDLKAGVEESVPVPV